MPDAASSKLPSAADSAVRSPAVTSAPSMPRPVSVSTTVPRIAAGSSARTGAAVAIVITIASSRTHARIERRSVAATSPDGDGKGRQSPPTRHDPGAAVGAGAGSPAVRAAWLAALGPPDHTTYAIGTAAPRPTRITPR